MSPASAGGTHESATADVPLDGTASRSRPRRSTVVLGVVLSAVVVASGAGFAWMSAQLSDSRSRITDQEQRLQDQQRELDEQREVIERKEQFGAAMADLYATVDPLVGLPYSSLVPWAQIEAIAGRAWQHRWTPSALDRDILDLETLTTDLVVRADAAREQAATNASGSVWEATLDELGGGWEFTNPEATASALTAFADDPETMADCYALTVLDGWTLEHEVPIDATSYWEVRLGYGYTCDDGQRQVIRDWLSALGVQKQIVGA